MLATAIIVAIPVLMQMRRRESDWKYAWAPILFIVGLAVVGCAYAFATPPNQKSIAVAGIAAMLLGLIFAQKTKDRIS